LSRRYPIVGLCEIANISRSGYYKFLSAPEGPKAGDTELVAHIRCIQGKVKQIYGYRRMKLALEGRFNISVNKKRVARLQKDQGLQALIRRKRFNYPVNSLALEPPKPNILARNFVAARPNQKWVTDITWIQVGSQRLYLSAVMDLFNREIVSYRVSDSIALPFVLETFEQAFRNRRPTQVLVHSDQGGHYTSPAFCSMLRAYNAVQSMSRKGNCWDNASMENFFGHFKSEMVHRLKPCSRRVLENHIHGYIRFYNHERIQEKMKMAPVAYRSHFSQTT
jgi:putative transposase